ncbi:MAG: glycosyltransferase 36, partial [Rhodothermaceae bacterium]|nr:glycosyltransferase 36 [Rhodothermaceae bacterium]
RHASGKPAPASQQAGEAHAGGADTGDTFFFLHRKRLWNPQEGVWMGWERKRGKLEEFNQLLRGHTQDETTYAVVEGDFSAATADNAIRYVITLDADTQLPPGAAADLVRTAAHPLNRPNYNPQKGRVGRGFGILQPRVGITAAMEKRTPFAQIYSGNVGVDPYTTAVSDIYQDLFGVGIFTGKGLYDVDAFHTALDDAIPENTVLSHDLLEGNYARAALLSDVTVFDDYPSSYTAFAKRLHRWVRGDWQILPWLFPFVRARNGKRRRNPVPPLGRWKTFDNLRRSLTPPALIAFLLLGWTILPGSFLLWTLLGLGILAFPIYAPFTSALLAWPSDVKWGSYLRNTLGDARRSTLQVALSVAFLAHQAILMTDAIARTLWRMVVSRKKLLEWTTAYQAEQAGGDAPGIWLSPVVGVLVLALVGLMEPMAAFLAVPFAAAWIAAPWVARRVSQPVHDTTFQITAEDRPRLRAVARRTWRFFDDFITAEDHFLPPDNYQEQPYNGLARRTSPTNIGMGLLAVQSAADFGYATRLGTVERLGAMLDTLDGLERWRGHFFNWYDTGTTQPLPPRYVSTVDSGNLVASLLTLRQALLEIPRAPWPNPALFDGLRDTVACLHETLDAASDDEELAPLSALADTLGDTLPTEAPATISAYAQALLRLKASADTLAAAAPDLDDESETARKEVCYWAARPARQIDASLTEIDMLAPWALTEHPPEHLDEAGSLERLRARTRQTDDESLAETGAALTALLNRSAALAEACEAMATAHDFKPLYDTRRDLFLIGYNVDSGQADASTYDLLASECRVASLIAIGKGDVPAEHWFRLGRPTTLAAEGYKALLSWSGTMFEYLMPVLFTRLYDGTLLAETARGAIGFQKAYGRRKSLPWGISESAYYTLDIHLTYQYRAFGVPGLGLKRGLADDYVVSPYASFLSMMVRPGRSLRNLNRLRRDREAYGPYGYYEAVDFTRERLPADEEFQVVQTYMAHHHGMSLLALVNVLQHDLVQERFHREPLVRSVELLLQERVPTELELLTPHPDELESIEPIEAAPPKPAVIHVRDRGLEAPIPAGMLLSNGHHTTFVTAAGAGYAHIDGTALTRWSPDRTCEHDGVFLYVRDLENGRVWSAGRQPICDDTPDRYEAWFHLNKVEIARVDDWIETFSEIVVSPEDNVELRRYTFTNYGDRPRTLEVTSYAEVVLMDPGADAAHPAFSKLFVRTEVDPLRRTLLASRRARAAGKTHPWLFHTLCGRRDDTVEIEFETDRMQFIGRNRSLAHPVAMDEGVHLSGTTGPVLDPIVSLRRPITLKPKERVTVTFALGTANSREEALRLADRYAHPEAVQRATELAQVYGLVELPHCGLSSERALYFQQVATGLLYNAQSLRASERVLRRNRRPQSGLWAYGISGDLPIVAIRVNQVDEVELVRLLLQAHSYWRLKGFEVDLVILNEHPPSYADEVQKMIQQAVETSAARGLIDQRGGVFMRRIEGMPEEDLTLILTVARLVIEGSLPDLSVTESAEDDAAALPYMRAALTREEGPSVRTKMLPSFRTIDAAAAPSPATARPARLSDGVRDGLATEDLLFFNGYGGFARDGREYVIRLGGDQAPPSTPLPWTNVIAHDSFGFLATESGTGMTWQGNSQMNKLTPWSNDPVADPAGEAVWLRDEDDGVFWSPTPQPTPGPGPYEAHHGWGYSGYRHTSFGIEAETLLFVPPEDPVKVIRLRLTNRSDRPRRLSVFRYQAWAMSNRRENGMRFVVVQPDLGTGALFAWNRYNSVYSDYVAFADAARLDADDPAAGVTHTADRTAFLGRLGTTANPAALRRDATLDDTTGAGLDPCAAFQVPITLEPGETAEVVCLLGQAPTREVARTLIRRYRDRTMVMEALGEITLFWQKTLGVLQVETPTPALDVLVNGWLLYQNLACRLWGRSAFYQSGGAFGFRDQIQDSLALLFTRPDLARKQILIHAAHQFVEGDVLHWWHPEVGAGIRTRFSDDLLWLPYATATYVRTTGDTGVLDEEVQFLTARALEEGEDEVYLTPEIADETGTLFEHACRAIDISLTAGAHGLPLMGSGDWNDGMNRVGDEGTGESVWLGFFLYDILDAIIPIAEARGDDRAERYRTYQQALREALNDTGWDGAWFRRAYYDDGTPLGSSQNLECRIDAIAQGWSVISGAGDPDKTEQALASAQQHLVDEEGGIIRLLTPPFDQTEHDPGYIKGYLPGVRENGGQYTHGILWLIRAFAERGHTTYAARLLEMILPSTRTHTQPGAERFMTEPYAVAADVYGAPPHVGRGGWTWYTGSAGWMYRVAVETVLGFGIEGGDTLVLTPRLPADWPGCTIHYRYFETTYRIEIRNPDGVEGSIASATLNDQTLAVEHGTARVPLTDDEREHRVQLTIGTAPSVGGDGAASVERREEEKR